MIKVELVVGISFSLMRYCVTVGSFLHFKPRSCRTGPDNNVASKSMYSIRASGTLLIHALLHYCLLSKMRDESISSLKNYSLDKEGLMMDGWSCQLVTLLLCPVSITLSHYHIVNTFSTCLDFNLPLSSRNICRYKVGTLSHVSLTRYLYEQLHLPSKESGIVPCSSSLRDCIAPSHLQ